VTLRRPHGTGSVYYDEARDRWVGSLEAGWTARGTRRRKRVVGKTEAIVRRKIREAMREAEAAEAPTVGGKPTVRTWAEQWLANTVHDVRPKTWATNRSAVRLWIIPTIGHRRLDQLGPADVRAVTRAILAAGRAPATASRAQAVLEGMLRAAIIEGHQVPQRALMVDGPAAGEHDRDAIPLPDALALLAAAATRPDASRWVAALLQGMRPAECMGLTWSCVDLDDGVIDVSWQMQSLPYNVPRDRSSGFRIPVGYVVRQLDGGLHLVRPKTASGQRVVPLVPWMAAALRAWQQDGPRSPHDLVWPRLNGRPKTDRADREDWVQVNDAAQVARVDGTEGRRYALYEARHTTATLLREAGVDDETITRIMGHASILSTRAYLHTSSAKTRAALTDLASRLGLEVPAIEG
jgi:integrase